MKVKEMQRYEKFISLFWLFLGFVIIIGAIKIGLGSLNNPGGGLFILILGTCLSLLALINFIRSHSKWIKSNRPMIRTWTDLKWEKALYIMIALTIYTFIISTLGYCLSTFFLLMFLFNTFEHQKWKVVAFEAILSVFLSYILFGILLEVRFPRGLFETLIGR